MIEDLWKANGEMKSPLMSARYDSGLIWHNLVLYAADWWRSGKFFDIVISCLS